MIKTIIFDWGGVLTIGGHTSNIMKLLEKKYSLDAKLVFSYLDNSIVLMDSGILDFGRFVHDFNKAYKVNISIEEMKSIFDEAIVPNSELINLLKVLKGKYLLVLLSNNNAATIQILEDKYADMLKIFDNVFFSCIMKLRKPDIKFFQYALNTLKLSPHECLFIDDKERNIKVAAELGMSSLLYLSNKKLMDDMRKLNISC